MQVLSVKLPDVGEGITEAELVEWHVRVGDVVREDDVVAAVMTDKATVEIPSIYAGTVAWLGGALGDKLAVGADLIRIETGDAETTQQPAEKASAQIEPPKPAQQPAMSAEPSLHTNPSAPLASPWVRAQARDAGIDLRQVVGSGPAGRITADDLGAFGAKRSAVKTPAKSPRDGSHELKVIGMRRKIAERMSRANARIPHITVVEEIDMTALEELRGKLNETRGEKPKLTILPFLTAVLSRAVVDHPEMNAHFLDDEEKIVRFGAVHVGIATMTEAGLIVPVLRHAETKGLFEAAEDIAVLAQDARDGASSRDALTGSTITVTSLGPLGALATTPIINPPEVAILGINKMSMRPHWDGTQFVPRKMMNISASFDHRVIDGWNAATFVQTLKTLLETPAMIFIEG